jgi:hypothetical protein
MTHDDDPEDIRALEQGHYQVMPPPNPPKPRRGTIDSLDEMPHRKRMRSHSPGLPSAQEGWRRSSRGNLYRKFGSYRAVVIRPNEALRKDEYSWLIANDETDICEFSKEKYESEDAAFDALLQELRSRDIA